MSCYIALGSSVQTIYQSIDELVHRSRVRLLTLKFLLFAYSKQVTDNKHHHDFVSTGVVTEKDKVIVSYAGNFHNNAHQYLTMAQLRFKSDKDADKFRSKAEELQKTSPEPPPLVFRNHDEDKLHDVLIFDVEEDQMEERNKRKDVFDIHVGMPSEGGELFMKEVTMKVVDVPRFDHFDPLATAYPEFSMYFMYGDKGHAFIAHIPTKNPDFQQVCLLSTTKNN